MKKRGQVWIETVIYTLIALTMIGAVIAFARPKIEKMQDQSIIESSIEMIKQIDLLILDIKNSPGNVRTVEVKMKKGTMTIDGVEDILSFKMDGKYQYSELNKEIKDGSLIVKTTKINDLFRVEVLRRYSSVVNVTFSDEDNLKTLQSSSSSYKLIIASKGQSGGNPVINFNL